MMNEPAPYATKGRVGCLMWLAIAALIMSTVSVLVDVTQELAWNARMQELNTLAANISQPVESASQPTEVPPPTTITEAVIVAASTTLPTNTPPPTSTPVPTDTPPLPTNTPLPAPVVVSPKDARDSLFVHGNNSPQLPPGEPNKVSVIAFGKMQGTILPIVVRNNTSTYVTRIAVAATARGADGNMLAAGGDQGIYPNHVQPGEIAFGYVYFGDATLPEGTNFEFQAEFEPAGSSFEEFETSRDLEITEVSLVEDRIVGLMKNQYTELITGPLGVEAVCFTESAQLLGHYSTYADQETIAAGATAPYQIDLYGDPCPVYLVSGRGFTE